MTIREGQPPAPKGWGKSWNKFHRCSVCRLDYLREQVRVGLKECKDAGLVIPVAVVEEGEDQSDAENDSPRAANMRMIHEQERKREREESDGTVQEPAPKKATGKANILDYLVVGNTILTVAGQKPFPEPPAPIPHVAFGQSPSPAEIWSGGVNVGDEIAKIVREEQKKEAEEEAASVLRFWNESMSPQLRILCGIVANLLFEYDRDTGPFNERVDDASDLPRQLLTVVCFHRDNPEVFHATAETLLRMQEEANEMWFFDA